MLYFLLTVSDSVCEQGPMLTAQRQENNVKAYDGGLQGNRLNQNRGIPPEA